MAETLILVTGTTVTHDEAGGLQNSVATPCVPGDANDNDVLFTLTPSTFSSRLDTLTNSATPIGAAESPGNVVTFSPTATLGKVALTDGNGAPLNGLDSGIDTTAGKNVLLYSDPTNDNIVLGRVGDAANAASATGTIVFAIYLEETGGAPPTGAKLWTVQYASIYHDGADNLKDGDGNNDDSAVDLSNKVFVTAFEAQTFSFANAPSGQNLFVAFGDASPALVITGEKPADQSAGQNV